MKLTWIEVALIALIIGIFAMSAFGPPMFCIETQGCHKVR